MWATGGGFLILDLEASEESATLVDKTAVSGREVAVRAQLLGVVMIGA